MAVRVQRVGVTMAPELFEEFKKKCEAEGKRSASAQITELVKAYLGNPEAPAQEQIFNLKVEIESIQRAMIAIEKFEGIDRDLKKLERVVERNIDGIGKQMSNLDARINRLQKRMGNFVLRKSANGEEIREEIEETVDGE